jgi:DNA-binding MarR family transcriptional regulator
VCFELNDWAVRSPEVEEALKRLVERGLVEESEGACRLTKRGNKLAERTLPNSGWMLPCADVVFFLTWGATQLAEYCRRCL